MVAYRQLPPSEHDSRIAQTSKQLLSGYARENQPLPLRVIDAEQDAEAIMIPADTFHSYGLCQESH